MNLWKIGGKDGWINGWGGIAESTYGGGKFIIRVRISFQPRLAIGQSWPWPQMTLARPGPRSDLPLTSPPPEPRTSVQLDPQLWPCVCVLGEETVAGFKFFQESRPQES